MFEGDFNISSIIFVNNVCFMVAVKRHEYSISAIFMTSLNTRTKGVRVF